MTQIESELEQSYESGARFITVTYGRGLVIAVLVVVMVTRPRRVFQQIWKIWIKWANVAPQIVELCCATADAGHNRLIQSGPWLMVFSDNSWMRNERAKWAKKKPVRTILLVFKQQYVKQLPPIALNAQATHWNKPAFSACGRRWWCRSWRWRWFIMCGWRFITHLPGLL